MCGFFTVIATQNTKDIHAYLIPSVQVSQKKETIEDSYSIP